MVKHELAQSAYKERVEQCASAVRVVQAYAPQVQSLRDVDSRLPAEVFARRPDPPARRDRHIVRENERVKPSVSASQAADYPRMRHPSFTSHLRLPFDYND